VHVEARIAREPTFDGTSLVGTVVIHDQTHVEFLRLLLWMQERIWIPVVFDRGDQIVAPGNACRARSVSRRLSFALCAL
jgi:hypothetical protein